MNRLLPLGLILATFLGSLSCSPAETPPQEPTAIHLRTCWETPTWGDPADSLNVSFTLTDRMGKEVTEEGRVTYTFKYQNKTLLREFCYMGPYESIHFNKAQLREAAPEYEYFTYEPLYVYEACPHCRGTGYIREIARYYGSPPPSVKTRDDYARWLQAHPGEIIETCPYCHGTGQIISHQLKGIPHKKRLDLTGEKITLIVEFQNGGIVLADSYEFVMD